MKPTVILSLAVAATGLLGSCNKSEETAAGSTSAADSAAVPAALTPKQKADELLTGLTAGVEKTVIALESVTDKASAETAAATIKEASADLTALSAKAQAVKDELSEEEKSAMETSAMAAMKPLMGRMTEVMQKVISNPETGEILTPVMAEFQKSMSPPKAPQE